MSVVSNLNKHKTLGIAFPIQQSVLDGVFDTTITSLQKAKANLYLLLMTGYGERPLMPIFGSPITQFLFENISSDTVDKLKDEISSSIKFWIPQIEVLQLNISDTNVDRNTLDIQIKFRLKSNIDSEDELVVQIKNA